MSDQAPRPVWTNHKRTKSVRFPNLDELKFIAIIELHSGLHSEVFGGLRSEESGYESKLFESLNRAVNRSDKLKAKRRGSFVLER